MQRFFVFIFLFSLTQAWAQLDNLPLQWHNKNGINTISVATDYQIQTITTDSGTKHILHADQANACLQKGMPSLPYFAAPLLMPDVKGLQALIIDSTFIVLNNIDLLPSKGDISRNINPDEVAYTFGKEFNTDAFYPQNILQHQEVFR
ncbi:MAG TPA: C25 family peptidase propeptide domain-containing protein, partial [Bacteroidia bacterium]|nr:C25 family peptidase propeptide domain-containing protein [Bacteroidia bacterium]